MQKPVKEQFKEVERQVACPSGEFGIKVAKTMNESNIGMTIGTIDFLEIKDEDYILELGHGNCGHLDKVLEAGKNIKYHGLEISETMFNEAQKNSSNNSNLVEFKHYDGEKIPYSDETFDKIFTVNTIYFWEAPEKNLTEMNRVLKKNGLCVLTYGNREFMEKMPFVGEKFKLYDQDMIKEVIAKTEFKLEEIKEISERITLTTGEEVDRTYTLVKMKKI
ncbi:MAG: class I SAM-dependent methyltransferase [Fusobacterium sp.]|nr:class I SAM-dependent methyltransferase [Fusobacterium sp.]